MIETRELHAWIGRAAIGRDGDRIGEIADIYIDQETGQPEWLAIRTGLFGSRLSFVPLEGAHDHDGDVMVGFSKNQIKDAPDVEADGELSQEEESGLYAHYDLAYSEARSDTGPPGGNQVEGRGEVSGHLHDTGRDTSGPSTDEAMTRSEEELRVGKASKETGRVRLRKWIETEHATQTVPLAREEVRVEREPITEANIGRAMAGPELSEEEHEMILHEEEPVVEKRVVPKERIRLDKDVVTEEREIGSDLRKEHIELESDDIELESDDRSQRR